MMLHSKKTFNKTKKVIKMSLPWVRYFVLLNVWIFSKQTALELLFLDTLKEVLYEIQVLFHKAFTIVHAYEEIMPNKQFL